MSYSNSRGFFLFVIGLVHRSKPKSLLRFGSAENRMIAPAFSRVEAPHSNPSLNEAKSPALLTSNRVSCRLLSLCVFVSVPADQPLPLVAAIDKPFFPSVFIFSFSHFTFVLVGLSFFLLFLQLSIDSLCCFAAI